MTDVKLAKILYQPLSTKKAQKASHNSKRLQYEIFASFEEDKLKEIVESIINKNGYLLMTKEEMLDRVVQKLREDNRYKSYKIEANKKLEVDGIPKQFYADIYALNKIEKKALIFEYMHTQQSKKTLLNKYANYDLIMSEFRIRFQLVVLNFDLAEKIEEEQSLFTQGKYTGTGLVSTYDFMNIGEILEISNDKIIVV